MEELPLGVDSAHAGLQPVTEHDEGVVIEQLRDGIQVVAVVFVEGVLDRHVMIL